jgi:hypothetical protein
VAELTPKKISDASVPVAASFASGNKLLGLVGAVVSVFPRSVFDAVYAVVGRNINTTAPLAGGGSLAADRTLTVAAATTSAVGVVELATDGEDAADKVVQGNDARMDNARTPTVHASTHLAAGSDPILGTALGHIGASYHPDRYPGAAALEAACSDEFTGGVESGTWRDGNTPARTLELDALKLSTTASEQQLRTRWATLPASGDFVVTARLSSIYPTTNAAGGLVILETGSEATPTLMSALMCYRNATSGCRIGVFTKTSYASAFTLVTEGDVGPAMMFGMPWYAQLRYVRSTKVLTYAISFDGVSFWTSTAWQRTLGADPISLGAPFLDSNTSSGALTRLIYARWVRTHVSGAGIAAPYPPGA